MCRAASNPRQLLRVVYPSKEALSSLSGSTSRNPNKGHLDHSGRDQSVRMIDRGIVLCVRLDWVRSEQLWRSVVTDGSGFRVADFLQCLGSL